MGAMAWSFESAVKVINHRSGHGEEKLTMDPNRSPIFSSHNSDQASHEVGGEIRLCSSGMVLFFLASLLYSRNILPHFDFSRS
ncbi:hypothetical protein U1Q18_040121 [Sarracenia purpurea var. burkii]